MKAMKRLALVLAAVMVLAVSSVAFAAASPSGSSVISVSDVDLGRVSSADAAQLESAAADYVARVYGEKFAAEELATYDLIAKSAGTITLNVAGVKAGDNIIVIHKKADGTIEIIPATVLANGVISFYMGSFSPISIVRVADAEAVKANKMYKTGDATNAAAMVLMVVSCGVVMMACGKALKA